MTRALELECVTAEDVHRKNSSTNSTAILIQINADESLWIRVVSTNRFVPEDTDWQMPVRMQQL